MSGDWMTMSYFDNHDNEFLNNTKKILKIEKNYRCVYLLID
jgi:hypothetical protein